MNVRGLVWLGIRAERFDETAEFFGSVLNLRTLHREPGFAVFETANGDKVEVFGPHDPDHEHFSTGPVAGFGVDDVGGARAEMEAAGVEFIGPVRRWEDGGSSAHFRGPDGNVYEITGVPPAPTNGWGNTPYAGGMNGGPRASGRILPGEVSHPPVLPCRNPPKSEASSVLVQGGPTRSYAGTPPGGGRDRR